MPSSLISPVPRALTPRDYAGARLNWLLAANENESARRRLFRTPAEEEQMLLMTHPVSTERAFAFFGMTLGTVLPGVIFVKLFTDALLIEFVSVLYLLVMVNVLCCLMGRFMGEKVSDMVARIERSSWTKMLFGTALLGALWGAVTGAMGGFLFFGIGAFFGAFFATAAGIPAFVLFTCFHRLLACGGMIERSHFVPLACGITLSIAALILGT